MAARKTQNLSQSWKDHIATTMLVKRLGKHAEGLIDLKPTQVEAIKVLLRKVAPDLASVAHKGDDEGAPIRITWEGK